MIGKKKDTRLSDALSLRVSVFERWNLQVEVGALETLCDDAHVAAVGLQGLKNLLHFALLPHRIAHASGIAGLHDIVAHVVHAVEPHLKFLLQFPFFIIDSNEHGHAGIGACELAVARFDVELHTVGDKGILIRVEVVDHKAAQSWYHIGVI